MANDYLGGGRKQELEVVVPLGTGAVSTQTNLVGRAPRKMRVTGIRFHGQAAVTGTSLTAEVNKLTTAGAADASMQSSATDIAFASAAAALAGVAAATDATEQIIDEGQPIEVDFTATAITAGPGDTLVQLEWEPAF